MARNDRFCIVLVTCGSTAEARKIAKAVVNKRLAACVNILTAPVESLYRWKGKLEKSRERLLIIKTSQVRLQALESEVLRLHSYETPEFIAISISRGSSKYLSWIAHEVSQ
ncbi:MAG TPA: divalent-cation tolerance protein CutA [Candidatus Acidoferrum sp.]|jgi:periplasmic divalent cation tolerance protein